MWKIIINKTTELCLNCILVISNRNSFRVLFDKITERYNYLYFSIGNGQPREPALCHLYCTIGIRFCSVPLRATLIFTSSTDYSLPRLRSKFGERAFSHAGPAAWNALPDHIRTVADPVKFRKLLKSHYFSQAFNIC